MNHGCDYCDVEYKRPRELKKHLSSEEHLLIVQEFKKNNKTPYQCDACDKYFETNQDFDVHKKKGCDLREMKREVIVERIRELEQIYPRHILLEDKETFNMNLAKELIDLHVKGQLCEVIANMIISCMRANERMKKIEEQEREENSKRRLENAKKLNKQIKDKQKLEKKNQKKLNQVD
jgi:hypothetical protein